jgi:hypothetical protein
MKYVYSFCVWPHERGFCREVYRVFDAMLTRMDMEFTEAEFGLFRAALERHGFTLREIERVPHHEPEKVL